MESDGWPDSEASSSAQSSRSPQPSVRSTSSDDVRLGTGVSSSRSKFTRHFTLSSRQSYSSNNGESKPSAASKGPYGINTVYRAEKSKELVAHLVFVHGLGGGSEHTWTKDGVHWPRDLLPKQQPLHMAAIHVFGYDSDFKKSSTLNIQDFSKSLLNGLLNNPIVRESKCPIILIGHSMGGLVMKKAFITARQTSMYEGLAARIRAMVFIATPHTGSQLAPILEKMFRMTSGLKPYLEDLTRNSITVQSINAEFPAQAADLSLYSFYETNPLSLGGIRDVMIVPKTDAVLNYPNEQSALLYGDHRSVCKFNSDDEHNFVVLWQTIAALIQQFESIIPTAKPGSARDIAERHDDLNKSLCISEAPADDLRWRDDNMPLVLWIRGSPGSGKSFVAGHVIEALEKSNHDHCYYFFTHGDRGKSSFEGFLLSMTWQMANIYDDVRKRIVDICSKDRELVKSGDHRALHRKLWEQGVLKAALSCKCYWVIDAFDECQLATELGKFLLRVVERASGRVSILLTSRNAPGDHLLSLENVLEKDIKISDTQEDIVKYLQAHKHSIPGSSPQERDWTSQLILQKSNGCFLWAILVLRRLAKIVGSQARIRALEEMPPGMDQLYSRILTSMSHKEKSISQAILMWVACAVRPLKTSELQYVLETITEDELDDIDGIVSRYCHDLVFIENSTVKMRHASARDFLLRQDINSDLPEDFTIREDEAHKELAMACLEFLNGVEMKSKPKRKMVASAPTQSVFISYACVAVHEHVNRASALDPEILSVLAHFLRTNVLSWIEHLAECGGLETVLRFAHVLRMFLRRKSRVDLLLGDDVVIIDAWASDLVRLVSKFGRQLLIYPESISQLIPPFCPLESAPYIQFARGSHVVLSVHGRIAVFGERTCLEERSLNHGAPVTHLQFAESSQLLASVSRKMLRLWNTETWEPHWDIRLRSSCIALKFIDDDKLLLVVLKNNTLLALNMLDRVESISTWMDILDEPHYEWYHGTSPQFASFNPDLGLVALAYSFRSLIVYNYDMDTYEIYHHKDGLCDFAEEQSHTAIYSMAFSALPDTSLLAVSYGTAELVLFNTEKGTIQATVTSAFFTRLVSSPDGRTLGASRVDGSIELYDFETLHKLYRIRPDEGAVSALSFTSDSTRFLVIRAGGHSCRLWEPPALYRRDVGHNSVRSTSLGSGSQDGVYDQPDEDVTFVSAIACDLQGDFFFVGKEDYSVSSYDGKTGRRICVLFDHVASIKTLHVVAWASKQYLVSVDSAGFLIVHRVQKSGKQLQVEKIFTHRGSVTGIQQLLCNSHASTLLVCSGNRAKLLSILTGEHVASQEDAVTDTDEHCIWAQHPVDDSLLICVQGHTVYYYNWSSLQLVGNPNMSLQLNVDIEDNLKVSAISALFTLSNKVLAIAFSVAGKGRQSTIACFPAQAFAVRSATADPLTEFHGVCDQIQLIIGMFRDRVVFLHMDGWVCSAKVNGMRGEGEGVMHHFAPPEDWLQTSRELLITISKAGDILFVVKGEVAVVKRGLARIAHIKT
ncbi:hypothetical protein GGR57DRAFT_501627 [Xylariaceae sp. FL1272]|nr:hypothetical protein GGR57DRAFT_501627 [Xylariaceae sp. FL1272]